MSIPMIATIQKEEHLSDDQVTTDHLWKAMQADLPKAVSWLTKLAEKAKESNAMVFENKDPNSDLGKQTIRIMAGDILRDTAEKKLGVHFGFVNCCGVKVGLTPESVEVTLADQVKNQNGITAHADC